MGTQNVWERALDLAARFLQLCSAVSIERKALGDYWPFLLWISLTLTIRRLRTIISALEQNDVDSALILGRSLFELDVNLIYISKDTANRLPEYLRHAGIPLTDEEHAAANSKTQEALDRMDARELAPKSSWLPLKAMCEDLGSGYVRTYETFYRYASFPTHAGAFLLGKHVKGVITQTPPSDDEKAGVLITALAYCGDIADALANAFPSMLSPDALSVLSNEHTQLCENLDSATKARLEALRARRR